MPNSKETQHGSHQYHYFFSFMRVLLADAVSMAECGRGCCGVDRVADRRVPQHSCVRPPGSMLLYSRGVLWGQGTNIPQNSLTSKGASLLHVRGSPGMCWTQAWRLSGQGHPRVRSLVASRRAGPVPRPDTPTVMVTNQALGASNS